VQHIFRGGSLLRPPQVTGLVGRKSDSLKDAEQFFPKQCTKSGDLLRERVMACKA